MADAARSPSRNETRTGAMLPELSQAEHLDHLEARLAYLDSLPPREDVRVPMKKPHAASIGYSHSSLAYRFPGAEVAMDLMVDYREPGRADPTELAPDVLVALRVPRRSRSRYDVNALGPPDFILEVLSRGSWRNDVGHKLATYERMGVREYLLFDPTGERFAGEDLLGYSLSASAERRRLEEVTLPNGSTGVHCALLGLYAYVLPSDEPPAPNERPALAMRWQDPATGRDVETYDEVQARAEAAERQIAELRRRLNGANAQRRDD